MKHLKIHFILLLLVPFLSYSKEICIEAKQGIIFHLTSNALKDSLFKKESVTNDYIGIYQKYISGIRGHDCPMYPSCSNYGLKAFNDVNFVSAFKMTSDRLLRCGHDKGNYSLTLRENGFKYIDFPQYEVPPKDLLYSRNSFYFSYWNPENEDSTFLFMEDLINKHYYKEALIEIYRIEFKTKTFNLELFINKIICLRAIGEYENAIFEYETKCPFESKLNFELVQQISAIHYKLQNFDQALALNKSILNTNLDSIKVPKILLQNGLIYANISDWQNSKKVFESLSNFESYKQVSISNFKISEKGEHARMKQPMLAGTLSIIPGLGYAYTGHRQTAFSALLINGLLSYATYSSFKVRNFGMGALTGVFNLSFYLGNIYGANRSAKRFNENQKKMIINKLEFNSNF